MIARRLYSLLLALCLPLLLLRLWWRGRREPAYREHVEERFGHGAFEAEARPIWIHAVSVGEARAAAPLAQALMRAHPHERLLVTCTTAAGREMLAQIFGASVRVLWLPWDLPSAVRRFLDRQRPRLGVLMETEVWPNLVAECRARGLPLVLANARMSEKSQRGYALWPGLTRPAFAALDAVCAQSGADARRLRELGARAIEVCGNLKFDLEPDPEQGTGGRAWRAAQSAARVLLLASTREGEEELLLDALPPDPGRLVVLVPRHARRFDAVAQLASQRGWRVARRSRGEAPPAGERALYLGDTMGEMAFYYAACDVAVIGGSFRPLGGQNLIEACAAGVPVVIGPSCYNFAEATRLALAAGAALQEADAPAALRAAQVLLGDASRRVAMAQAGIALCAAHRGATARNHAACAALLSRQARAEGRG